MTKPTLVQSILNLPSQTYSTQGSYGHSHGENGTASASPSNNSHSTGSKSTGNPNHAHATRPAAGPVKKDYYSTKQEMMRIAQAANSQSQSNGMAQQQQQQQQRTQTQSNGRATLPSSTAATRRPEASSTSINSTSSSKPLHPPPSTPTSTATSRPPGLHPPPPSSSSRKPPPKITPNPNPNPNLNSNLKSYLTNADDESDFADSDDSDLDAFFTPNTSPRTSMASSAATIRFPTAAGAASSRRPSRRSLTGSEGHQGLQVPSTADHPVPTHTRQASGSSASATASAASAAVPSTRTPSTPTVSKANKTPAQQHPQQFPQQSGPRHILSSSSSLSSNSLEAHSLLTASDLDAAGGGGGGGGSGASTVVTTPVHSDSSGANMNMKGQVAKSTTTTSKRSSIDSKRGASATTATSNAPTSYKGAKASTPAAQSAVSSPAPTSSTSRKSATPTSSASPPTSTTSTPTPKDKGKGKEKYSNANEDTSGSPYGTVTILPSGAPSSTSASSRSNKKYVPPKQPHTFSAFASVSPTGAGETSGSNLNATTTTAHLRSSSTPTSTSTPHNQVNGKTTQSQSQSAERHKSASGVPSSTTTQHTSPSSSSSSTLTQAQKSARHASAPPTTSTSPRFAPSTTSRPTQSSTQSPAQDTKPKPSSSPSPSPKPSSTPTYTPTSTPSHTPSPSSTPSPNTTPPSTITQRKKPSVPKPLPSGMVGMDALLEEEEDEEGEGENGEGEGGKTPRMESRALSDNANRDGNRRAAAWDWGSEWEKRVAAADAAATSPGGRGSGAMSTSVWGEESDENSNSNLRPSRSLRHTSPHASDMRRRRSRSLDGGLDRDEDDYSSSHSSGSTKRHRKSNSTSTHSNTHTHRSPPQTLSAEVRALVSDFVSPADRRASKATQGYTSLVLPRAPPPHPSAPSHFASSALEAQNQRLGKLLPVTLNISLKDSWLAPDGKIDLTKAGLASTTMASVEVVRGLGGSSTGGILGGLLGFGRRRAWSAGSVSMERRGPKPVPVPLSLKPNGAEAKEDGNTTSSSGAATTPSAVNTILGFTSYRKPPNYVPSGSVLVQVWAVGVDGVDGRLVGVRFGAGSEGAYGYGGRAGGGRGADSGTGNGTGAANGTKVNGEDTNENGHRERDIGDESWEEVRHTDLELSTENDHDHENERTETETEQDHLPPHTTHSHIREAEVTGDETSDRDSDGEDELQMHSTPVTPLKKGGFAKLGRTWSFKLGRSHTAPSKGKDKDKEKERKAGDVLRSKSASASASTPVTPARGPPAPEPTGSASASANSTPSKSRLRFDSKVNGRSNGHGHGHASASAPATPSNGNGGGHKRSLSFSLGLKRNNTDVSQLSSATTGTTGSSSSQNTPLSKDKALPRQPQSEPKQNLTKAKPPPKKLKRPAKHTQAEVGYIPGRSFVGRVLEVGWEVRDEVVRKGEWVVGLLDVRKAGALAEFIVVDRHRIHRVPHPWEGPTDADTAPPTSPTSAGGSGRPPAPRMLTLEELALLPLCGIPAYRAVRTFMYAFSSSPSSRAPGMPSISNPPTSPSARQAQGFDFSSPTPPTPTRKGSLSRGTNDHAQGYRRRALVLRGHDGPGAMAVQMLVRRGWRVSVHVPFSSVPANATQEAGDRYMHVVEERAREWGADEVIFDDGEVGGGGGGVGGEDADADGRGAAVRVLDTLREDGDVFDAVLDTIGGREVREAAERLLRSNGPVNGGSQKGKRRGVGQFTTLVGDHPERTIPSAGDHFRAGLRSLRPAGGAAGGDQQPTTPNSTSASASAQGSLTRSNSTSTSTRVGYAWVSIAQDVDWEGDDISETLRMVLRLALEDGVRPLAADLVSVDEGDGKTLVRTPRAVGFERAPGVFVDNGPLRDGGTVVVRVAQ